MDEGGGRKRRGYRRTTDCMGDTRRGWGSISACQLAAVTPICLAEAHQATKFRTKNKTSYGRINQDGVLKYKGPRCCRAQRLAKTLLPIPPSLQSLVSESSACRTLQ